MNIKALLVIDLQNDYFPNGKFPLWNTEQTLLNIKIAIAKANDKNIPVIYIQHVADPVKGIAPFFNEDSEGVKIHPSIMATAQNPEVVVKKFSDSFEKTNLEKILISHDINEILICGMMTQNCVTHTAISKAAEKYKVSIMTDCCTTVDKMIHNIALNGVSTRVPLVTTEQVL
ncbi:MAG: cysteine hydrolase [Gammaproteobacteria bacterium]|nr:cysteine hydrolase [Gammaproteobacteria bacterium]